MNGIVSVISFCFDPRALDRNLLIVGLLSDVINNQLCLHLKMRMYLFADVSVVKILAVNLNAGFP